MNRPLHALTAAELTEICRTHFGIDAEVGEFLPGEIAINVRLHAAGRDYVLKAEYPTRTMGPGHIDWITRVQETAARAGLPVAGQVPARTDAAAEAGVAATGVAEAGLTRSGEEHRPFVASVDVPAGTQPALMRIQEYLPGRVAAGAHLPEDYPAQVGRTAAEVVNALAGMTGEPGPMVHPWSFETTGANVLFACQRIASLEAAGQVAAELSGQLSGDLALARAAAQRFEADIVPQLDGLERQVVHQDLNDFNLLVADGQISGIIDFGDARTAPRVAELAIAAAYTMLGTDRPLTALRQVVAAYQTAAAGTPAELTDTELGLIEHAAFTRLCLNACIWTSRTLTARPDDPRAAYGRERMKRTWPVLREVLR
ncbi:phosphotransferase [Brevibacterium sp. p3-SID960]|uniref:phosphotransferase n=1 Tax=Brevibacterium sp. p3-SID960 TaxID=2916063 RepID=UPI0021A79AEE|nr:phosphotransferase [Brevibacterium sp. p3-SID960]MCT1690872.1 phosphotransferase [Brevibacterium sp. p3-SID960]